MDSKSPQAEPGFFLGFRRSDPLQIGQLRKGLVLNHGHCNTRVSFLRLGTLLVGLFEGKAKICPPKRTGGLLKEGDTPHSRGPTIGSKQWARSGSQEIEIKTCVRIDRQQKLAPEVLSDMSEWCLQIFRTPENSGSWVAPFSGLSFSSLLVIGLLKRFMLPI